MANNLTSNITRKLARIFLEPFENERVISREVDTQLLQGRFTPASGSTVDFKRPHDWTAYRSANGDISAISKDPIVAGKATGTVQPYFTASTEWENVEEALELDQLDQILEPMAQRIVTDMEVDLARFIAQNVNLVYGDPDQPVNAWSEVANAKALAKSSGVPGPMCYFMNSHTTADLADVQSSLNTGENLVTSAWETSMISKNFAGMKVFDTESLYSFTSGTESSRSGTTSAAPDATYVTAKDTMTQSIAITGFGAGSDTIKAGEVIEITAASGAVNRLNQATRQQAQDGTSGIKWRGVVTADVALSGGAGTLVVAGPAIYNASSTQYNTVTQAIESGDTVTLLGTENTTYQPNIFFHKQCAGVGTVKLPKLYSTDTVVTTKDGFSLRVSKYSDGDKNEQRVRVDLLAAYAMFNPFFGGQAFGVA